MLCSEMDFGLRVRLRGRCYDRAMSDAIDAGTRAPKTSGSSVVATLSVITVLGAWLLIKARLFVGLEYSWDLFLSLQLSRSWLLGRPLLWENRLGRDQASQLPHNFFLAPLLGPFTLHLGAYGLFLAHAGLLILAFLALDRALRPWSQWRRLGCAMALLLGPVGFWIWDNPFYGWTPELLYLPLSVLFACALECRSRLRLLWGALLVLLREDGAVVACSVQLLHNWLSTEDRGWSQEGLRRSVRIAAAWFVVFLVGLGVQRWSHPLAKARLTDALSTLTALSWQDEATSILGRDAAGALLLLGSGLLIAAPRCRGAALVAALPVLAVALVGTLAYDPEGMREHGLSWAPRFVMLWGIVGGAVAASPRHELLSPGAPGRPFWSSMVASVVAQLVLLALFKSYWPTGRVAQALPSSGRVLVAKLSKRERAFLDCLSDSLPTDTPLAAHARLFAYFHKHDLVWARYPQNAWRRPTVVVCESRGELPKDKACPQLQDVVLAAGFRFRKQGGITVAYDPVVAPHVERCGELP